MITNIRAKVVNNNGASIAFTWRNVEVDNEQHAHELGRLWAVNHHNKLQPNNVPFPYQTKTIEISLPSTEELDKEQYEYLMDEALAGLL